MGKELQRYQRQTEKGCSLQRERGGGGEYGTGESDANANGVAIDYRQEKNRQKQ
jgi:hypothetical protein